ncbi:MAG TPA: tetratricopeptide repeat protein [Candidatus Sulfotelmatobacter sp.]|nr:tetratricopeptide repeat protein [Candidatus Sulfotelmatobacter sp.]
MIVKLGVPWYAFVLMLGAGSCFSQATADKQQEFAAHMQKARAYLDQKQPALAIPEFQAAVAIDPGSVDAQANLGVLLFFQGKPADSIPHFRAALDRQPGLAKIQGLLGMAESRTLDFADARKDMESALPAIPDQRFQVQLGLELIGLDTESGDLERASAVVAQLRKAEPDNPELLYAAYRTYSDLAGEAMLALSLAAPDSAQMHQLLAHEDVRQGNTTAAVAQYRKAIAIDPHLPGVHYELAELLHTSSDQAVKKESEDEYHAALKENAQDEKSILRLAEIDAQKGNSEQSHAEYEKAVALRPSDADAKLGLAKSLIEMNQPDKALALLEETVQLEPTNATAHYRLATLYRKTGRADDSKREMDLYKKFKEMKEKLSALYKELQVQPKEIRAEEQDEQ